MKRILLALALVVVVDMGLSAQGALSNQVLQLLSRVNSWTATNTFSDLRLPSGPCASVPATTTGRIYTDASCNLYFNGGLIAGSGGVTNPHNLLSTTHPDTLAASVVRGDVIIGNSTPAWSRLAIGSNGAFLSSNGTDVSWGTNGSALTNLNAANLTGTIAAISGVNLTNLNASNLASGTVPLARISGLTNSQLSGTAGITYANLTLTGGILNADINAAAAIAYSKLNLSGAIQTTDLGAAIVTFAKWATNSCTNLQVPQFNGTSWVCKSLVTSDVMGAGTVSSVALSLPAFITVSGSPVTTSGTLTGTLATQSANNVFAGPTSGGASAPTFRALVAADLPTITSAKVDTSIAVTGVDINTSSQVTATHLASALPLVQGGTGLTTVANNSVIISNGSVFSAKTVPDCNGANTALQFTQSTNSFGCANPASNHNLLSATHSDTVAASVVRGDLIIGSSVPKWTRLPIGSANALLASNGTDVAWSTSLAALGLANSAVVTWTGRDTLQSPADNLLQIQNSAASRNGYFNIGSVTVLSGFGTSPSVTGTAMAFRVTIGTPTGTSGIVQFGTAFSTAPSCLAQDETSTAANPVKATATTSQVTLASAGLVAADLVTVLCVGY